MLKKALPYLILVPLILILGYWWSNGQLTSEGQRFQHFLNEVRADFPSLEVEVHESSGYFPCLHGNYQGLEIHIHHEFRHPDSRKGYIFLKIWQEDDKQARDLKISPKKRGLNIKSGGLSEKQKLELAGLDISGWELSIENNILLFEEIPYLNKYTSADVQSLQNLIQTSINIYQEALE